MGRQISRYLLRVRGVVGSWCDEREVGSVGAGERGAPMVRLHRETERDELARIRAAVRDAVDVSGLRPIARAVGMTPTALGNFLDGTLPYAKSWIRLRRWYYLTRSTAGGFSADDARALMLELLRTVPSPEAALPEVLDIFVGVHLRAGEPVPPWLRALRENRARSTA